MKTRNLIFLSAALTLSLLAACDPQARENARVLAEFRGEHYLSPAERRPAPGVPPLVPHKVYGLSFDCAKCHTQKNFTFAGFPVPTNSHPDRVACLQCHVTHQPTGEPFRFDGLRKGDQAAAK